VVSKQTAVADLDAERSKRELRDRLLDLVRLAASLGDARLIAVAAEIGATMMTKSAASAIHTTFGRSGQLAAQGAIVTVCTDRPPGRQRPLGQSRAPVVFPDDRVRKFQ
jgi:hypothetical protein